MKIMKSGIEMDAKDQEKIKGGYCVCYCTIGVISRDPSRYGIEGDACACTCNPAQDELEGNVIISMGTNH